MCEKLDLLVCTTRDLQPLTRFRVHVPSSQVFTAAPHLTPLSSTERKQKEILSRRRIACPPDTVSSVSTTQSGIASRASLNIRLNINLPDPDSNWKSPNIRCAARKLNRSVGVCLFAGLQQAKRKSASLQLTELRTRYLRFASITTPETFHTVLPTSRLDQHLAPASGSRGYGYFQKRRDLCRTFNQCQKQSSAKVVVPSACGRLCFHRRPTLSPGLGVVESSVCARSLLCARTHRSACGVCTVDEVLTFR